MIALDLFYRFPLDKDIAGINRFRSNYRSTFNQSSHNSLLMKYDVLIDNDNVLRITSRWIQPGQSGH